ncbi:MAG: dihydrofolate reductase family protein [Geobacteraceae bacterium]|nr:dihydrofolate reductase family protein [Geobacteraceae bacterium]
MRKLIMWNLMTLDGYFEGPNRDIDWHEDVWGDELEQFSIEQCQAAGAFLFGRVTYELMANYWPSAKGEIADFMNGLPKIVASRTMEKADWHNTRLVRENVPEEIARLKAEFGKDIFIFGSADLSASLIPQGLIDEFRLCVVPTVLGGGSFLFKASPERLKLRLLDSRPLETGAVILRYQLA